jgi:leader peptidase (prepilin peptidase)/N-methyltransferase
VGLASLYWLEVQQLVLWPANLDHPPSSWILHSQYLSHVLLICLMIVATFIDLDEQTIPDEITLLGTVAAVALVALLPYSLLPTVFEPAFGHPSVHHVVLTSSNTAADWRSGLGGPASWPEWLDEWSGLAIALAAVWCWGVAVLHKRWTLRYGLRKAICYSVASVVRHRTWRAPLKLVSLLSLILVIAWSWGGRHWESTLTSVIGLAAGGALIWAVRLVGGRALNMEAMGFGDVTLMAMIGAYLGWQASFLIFFMAPFSALVIAVAQWALSGDRHIAFGPYLCLSAVLLIVNWNAIWTDWARLMFSFGWFIPGMFACCLVLMGGLLSLWRIVRDGWLFPPEESWHE